MISQLKRTSALVGYIVKNYMHIIIVMSGPISPGNNDATPTKVLLCVTRLVNTKDGLVVQYAFENAVKICLQN